MTLLHVSHNLSLPVDAITQTFALLAVRGAGKSNTAAVMAEEMYGARLPFVVIDPVGAWWGLRSSADGKEPGLPIPIFGGKHGDIPLEKTGGALVADAVVDQRLSCVVDISEFEHETDRIHFLLHFARRLYHRNEAPLHLFLEEADEYIPQTPDRGGEEAHLVRAWKTVVKRGRSRGLGCTLITQRSAALNKDVLTQVETLIAMRTPGPQDRKAIEAWVAHHGQADEIVESLPSLKDGEAWVWSPHWLGKAVRVQMRRRATFDSGATPKISAKRRAPATLADVDMVGLQRRMAETIERSKADDPKLLRARIKELERAANSDENARLSHNLEVAREELRQLRAVPVERSVLDGEAVQALRDLQAVLADVLKAVSSPATLSSERGVHGPAHEIRLPAGAYERERNRIAPNHRGAQRSRAFVESRGAVRGEKEEHERDGLSGPERRILDALAWFASLGIGEPEQTAVAFLADYTVGGGAFNNPKGSLRTKGLIEYGAGDTLRLTPAGLLLAEAPEQALTDIELQRRVLDRLPGPEKKLLTELILAYPDPISNVNLAQRTGYSVGGGAFNNPRGRLRTLGLITYPERGLCRAADLLFIR